MPWRPILSLDRGVAEAGCGADSKGCKSGNMEKATGSASSSQE